MTLYISEKSDLRTAAAYLIISVILAFAGAVYEYFSFGVYSYFMIYAFAIPLCLGTIPFMIKYMRSSESNGKQQGIQGRSVKTQRSEDIYHSASADIFCGKYVESLKDTQDHLSGDTDEYSGGNSAEKKNRKIEEYTKIFDKGSRDQQLP